MVLLRFWLTGFTLIAAQHGRWITAAVFLFTMSMCARPSDDWQFSKETTGQIPVRQAVLDNVRHGSSSIVTLLDLPLTTLDGFWTVRPLSANSAAFAFKTQQNGLAAYLRWESQVQSISVSSTRHLHYELVGTLNWCLLGVPLYRQSQQFSGEIAL